MNSRSSGVGSSSWVILRSCMRTIFAFGLTSCAVLNSIVPDGSGKFIEANRAATEGRCDQSESLLRELPNWWVASNKSGVENVRLICRYYWRGDISAENDARTIANSNQLNASQAASMVADMRAHACDLDGAVEWTYRAQRNSASYRAASAIAESAAFYAQAGRIALARRNARQYLDQFAVNWYSTDKGAVPSGYTADVESLVKFHKAIRASMWLMLVGLGDHVAIPPEEIASVREVASPDYPPFPARGPAFYASSASTFEHLNAMLTLEFALNARDTLKLSLADVEMVKKALEKHKAQLQENPNNACAETVAVVERLGSRSRQAEQVAESSKVAPTQQANEPGGAHGDGIAGAADKCPNESEVFNGVVDDGCPDKSPVYIEERQIVITDQIKFETDRDTLLSVSYPILDRVSNLLRKFPQVKKVRIDGHTDSRGTPEHNLELSRRRANAVKTYLASKGTDPDRLMTAGFGSSIPIAYGNDETSWSVNRRVEFIILEADPIRVLGQSNNASVSNM